MHKEIMDGNTAAAHIAYAFSDMAGIYPITPSSTMAESVDIWQTEGRKNLFGQELKVVEMQSEAGVAGFVHGALKTGALTTTFTSSQGLLLMLPNLYKIAGELLPAVFHVAARAVTTNALSIFGDHSDVMSVRQSGCAMLAESSVQEVMDLSVLAHLATLETSIPFVSFFDGFRTSHELQRIEVFDNDDLRPLLNEEALAVFRSRAMNPNHPKVSGSNQGPELYFQQRETVNRHYQIIPYVVQKYMQKINALRGTHYDLMTYYGDKQASELIIAMGSVAQTIEQTVYYLNQKGRKVGFINVHLYRPFPKEHFLAILPKSVQAIAVLDRTKEPGAIGEPLFMDVQSALFESACRPKVIGGRYGIGCKDTGPEQIIAVFDELQKSDAKKHFTLGIEDDVTHLSLALGETLDLTGKNSYQVKFWGLGGDGTVSLNKSNVKIIGEHTDKEVQAYFYYDSRKQNGLTVSHLRFSPEAIKSSYFVQEPDFVGVSTAAYLRQYDLLKGLKQGGIFLLNTTWSQEQLHRNLPANLKKYLADHQIRFYTINAYQIAQTVGLDRKSSICMQTAFFKLTQLLPMQEAILAMKDHVLKTYKQKSPEVVAKNLKAIALSMDALQKIDVPKEWSYAQPTSMKRMAQTNAYFRDIQEPTTRLEGDTISVGQLIKHGMVAGDLPLGQVVHEKRSLALEVPEWNADACIQCNQCAFVCPHAAIRPFLIDQDELNVAPKGYNVRDFKGQDGLLYRIQVSVENCTGCELCVKTCPARGKALKMVPVTSDNELKMKEEAINWAFAMSLRAKENPAKPGSLLFTQFEQPLLEFSGACPGCGETPYIKLLTQLFGDRMMVANATGCSSIWGVMAPATPYSTNALGQGPALSNSLLEDNAEFGYGMMLANKNQRQALVPLMQKAMPVASLDLKALMQDWIEHLHQGLGSRARSAKLRSALSEEMQDQPLLKELYAHSDLFVKPSQWLIGGDGWAYDIGFGGLDHVLASGADLNILVLDNETYSNTGGHVSKGTPKSAIAKFSSSGNRGSKKDLGMMAMTYGNVYVAQVASGANPIQLIKAFEEAERYPGPSLIIAYVPCISHGLAGGLKESLEEAREAVASGYWSLYRYNPQLQEMGKNPMQLDYKRPQFDKMIDFMVKQERFSALEQVNPIAAKQLLQETVSNARRRFLTYAKLSGDHDSFISKSEVTHARANAKKGTVMANDSLEEILKSLDF
ncbi:pyruvate:ferredoxin (flavodoxin) oxidoreductase [Streptococcus iniae]|uniref:Pyruvate-flavodoxin oxidoreductase n=1 Tax=Streptococcus iniae TaxID=1346 RepID=A0ABM5QH20_STRIN|nr:pyruvate:ferredoxin (flavodoxin) oxidoreductase [Streptococcus iniae]AGM98049.1 putative pyruvate ferredoxin/flavodoxin oxidoreductase family protein [Streptococcus iniae SF1]AHY15120.1 pyruvate-flavodoxin oxidoreductase [Streptococcus iniae]AHY16990.1 pyruvate-flavodoxin oxidoreductase [Streptococcus iniae]AJG25307.1 pyruvate-flavodoxin oxidoreductase [Streptococcus iniae]APD31181.1 pyruvate:ferredoxin (flavodoxin) oxidoreductase [Streptococcus iniae]